jgi:hypothetical protein
MDVVDSFISYIYMNKGHKRYEERTHTCTIKRLSKGLQDMTFRREKSSNILHTRLIFEKDKRKEKGTNLYVAEISSSRCLPIPLILCSIADTGRLLVSEISGTLPGRRGCDLFVVPIQILQVGIGTGWNWVEIDGRVIVTNMSLWWSSGGRRVTRVQEIRVLVKAPIPNPG